MRVTDAAGNIATATLTEKVVTIGVSNYEEAILATPSLLHFYPLGETSGPTDRTTSRAVRQRRRSTKLIYGAPGAVNGDTATSVELPRRRRPARGRCRQLRRDPDEPLQPERDHRRILAEVEQLRQRRRAGDGAHAQLQRTTPAASSSIPTRRSSAAPSAWASAAAPARNSIFFTRPSAGVWHHYAFVLDTTAPAASEIIPYVDGQKVSFQQEGSGTGGGPFANSTLYLMSRDASSLFGSGYLRGPCDLQRRPERSDDRRTLRRQRHRPAPDGRLQRHPQPRAPGSDRDVQRRRIELQQTARSSSTNGT